MIPIYNSEYPARQAAIQCLERISGMLDKPKIFDKAWFDFEDSLTEIIACQFPETKEESE